jgi:Winged helix-turn helix
MHTSNMPLPPAPKLSLTLSDRKQLLEISRHRSTPRGIVLRVDIVLGAAEGIANHVLARNLSTSLPTVLLWRRRFNTGGLAAVLEDRPRSGRPKQISAEQEEAIVKATMKRQHLSNR